METPDKNFAGYVPADMDEYALGGGIPQRYKNMGFNKVGVKKESNRPGKKWMVLAKKGDKYKVVHGGYKGMKDFTQHGSEKRRDRFWDRMGGRDSAKAKDPFSPLYWHKKFGTWEQGGQIFNEDSQDFYQDGRQVKQALNNALDYINNWSANADQRRLNGNSWLDKVYTLENNIGNKIDAGVDRFNQWSARQDANRLANPNSIHNKLNQYFANRDANRMEKGGWIQDVREDMEEKGTVGAFTKQARREGYDDVQEFAGYVLENPAQFTPTTKKRAQFAKNMGKLQKAMHGMELKKYQTDGETGSEQFPIMLDEVEVVAQAGPGLPSKGLAPIPIEMPKLGPMPTITAPPYKKDPAPNMQTISFTGYGYEPMGSKDDPWWQRGAAIGAYAPGIIANQINSATDNRREAVARTKNNLTDYTDNIIQQGLALNRGEREMNTDQLDVIHRTPVQFQNYFQDGGEAMVDQSILEALIAAGADIEILD